MKRDEGMGPIVWFESSRFMGQHQKKKPKHHQIVLKYIYIQREREKKKIE